jgi:DNA-binding transcriptional LysR family regulator
MELRHLRYLVAVAKEGNFSRAAKALGMAQPPLSQQIRDLEAEIGVTLFERTNRGIRITPAGEGVIEDAHRVLKSVSELTCRSKLRSRGVLGRVNVGMIPSVMNEEFHESLCLFREENPNVELVFSDLPSNQLMEQVVQGTLDVGFLRTGQTLFSSLDSLPLFETPMRMALPKSHALAKRKQITWQDLAAERFILLRPEAAPDYYEEFYAHCRAAGFEPRVEQYVNSVAAQFWIVSLGLGVGLLPIVPEFLNQSDVTIVCLPDTAPCYVTSMVWRRGERSGVINRFVDFMRSRRETLASPSKLRRQAPLRAETSGRA